MNRLEMEPNWPNAMTCSMADLTCRGQPRGRWILGGFACSAILPPLLLRFGTTAYTAGHYGPFRAAQESVDERTHHASRVMIDDDSQPPTERPALRQRKRQPRCPEAGSCGYGGQINVPDVVRVLGGRDTVARYGCLRWRRTWWFLEHPADRRCAEVQARTAERVRDLGFAQGWAECLETLHRVPHEVGELVDGLPDLH